MNKYKSLALLISIIFIISFASTAVFAHPGHGSEYDIEEVTTGGGSGSSGSGSASHVSSSSGGSGSSGSGSASHVSSSAIENPSSVEEIESNSTAEELEEELNNTGSDEISDNNDDSNLFSLTNIFLLIGVLICGFLGVIIVSKLLSN